VVVGVPAAFGAPRHHHTRTPPPRKIQTISDSVTTVTAALARKMAHSSLSVPMFFVVSLYALIAMMPITAAPTP
jgi:hypothetical protein